MEIIVSLSELNSPNLLLEPMHIHKPLSSRMRLKT